jgi:ribosomal protein L13
LYVRKGQKNIDFERNHGLSIRIDRRVFDMKELESEVRSLVSGMVPWKTRGFKRNHGFSIRIDRRVFNIKELESEVKSLVSGMIPWKTRGFERNHVSRIGRCSMEIRRYEISSSCLYENSEDNRSQERLITEETETERGGQEQPTQ